MYVSANRFAESASSGQASATQSDPSATSMLSDTQSMFLTLLTTELKTQDPTSPQDPTQMVSQLVQFNTLNEVISINDSLQTLVSNTTQTASTTTPTGGQ